MPVTRDRPSIQGGCPWPRPRQGSPYQGGCRAGPTCRGSRRGLPCLGKARGRGAPLPPRAGRAWSTFGPHAIGAERFATVSAVLSGLSFARAAGAILRNEPERRSLTRMRSQVQVLAGELAAPLHPGASGGGEPLRAGRWPPVLLIQPQLVCEPQLGCEGLREAHQRYPVAGRDVCPVADRALPPPCIPGVSELALCRHARDDDSPWDLAIQATAHRMETG
jgi:hypothetical protein